MARVLRNMLSSWTFPRPHDISMQVRILESDDPVWRRVNETEAASQPMKPRRVTRFAVQLPVSFHGDDIGGEGTVLNLSPMGCAITAAQAVVSGSYLRLDIRLKETEEPVHVELAAIRWVSGMRFGLEFIRFGRTDGERIRLFVKALESTGER